MSERKRNGGKLSPKSQSKIRKRETPVAKLEGKAAAKANGPGKIAPLRPRANEAVLLESDYEVDLAELERKMNEKYSALSAKERELQQLEKKIYAEVEKLLAEIKERDLLLAAREVEIRNLKQSLSSRLDDLESLVKGRSVGARTARLVSFLVDIGKRH
jgi:hypothetical protein